MNNIQGMTGNRFSLAALAYLLSLLAQPLLAQPPALEKASPPSAAEWKQIVNTAFLEAHDGYSVDEVLLRDDLQAAFLRACQRRWAEAEPERCNWTLLNLRKAGKLTAPPAKPREPATREADEQADAVRHAAEIAARSVQDRHRTSFDRILANPEWRAEFDTAAQQILPEGELYDLRKSAFQLRKTRKLQPELITRLADWGREVQVYRLEELRTQTEQIPEGPGIYLFRDATGYLYIGEAANLRKRLEQHLDLSDRRSLADYLQQQTTDSVTVELHTFAPDSRIQELAVRRAYESELIRSRHPRFNIRP